MMCVCLCTVVRYFYSQFNSCKPVFIDKHECVITNLIYSIVTKQESPAFAKYCTALETANSHSCRSYFSMFM